MPHGHVDGASHMLCHLSSPYGTVDYTTIGPWYPCVLAVYNEKETVNETEVVLSYLCKTFPPARLGQVLRVLVAEMDLDEPADRAGEAGPRGEDPVAAASQRREARETQPAQAAAILSGAREEIPAISGVPPEILGEDPEPKRRLPFIKEFVSKGGDWVAFSRRFKATSELAAYPRMDKEGLDALVLDGMLGLAKEFDVALPTTDDDDDLTSLRVARSIPTHIHKCRAKVVACASPAKEESDDEGEPSQAFASLNEGGWRKNRPGQRDDRDQRTGASSKPASSPVVCFKCSNPGHISKGCRTDPGSTSWAPVPSGRPSSGPQGSQASRAAPHTRPSHSHHASMMDVDRHSQGGGPSARTGGRVH
ncbi:unnamed protein product [Lampetra planeri]